MASGISIYYNKTNRREYWLLRFLAWITPLHSGFVRRNRIAWGLSTKDLQAFPEGTLGNSLGNFLYEHGLEPVDKAERHDCFHVLLKFGTSMIEETKMQWFLVGSGKLSLFTTGSAILALCVLPENAKLYYKAFMQGRKSVCIDNWNFYKLLNCNTAQLQHLIFNTNEHS
ncbi:MAG: hypothetical protein RL660_2753 [Bacteroidota bacterium]|jgi:hypothetical protein